MKKFYLRLTFLPTIMVLLISAAAASGEEAALDTASREYRIVFVDPNDKDTGRNLLRVAEYESRTEESTHEGRPVWVMRRVEKTEHGDRIEWDIVMEPDTMRPIEVHKKVVSRKGNVLEDTREYYREDLIEYGDNVYHFQAMTSALQYKDIAPGKEIKFSFAFNPGVAPWTVNMLVEGEESVTVPAGTFDCYKIKMSISEENLGSGKSFLSSYVLKIFLPDYYLWVDKNEPHVMVRYQGKFGGFTSPEQRQELVQIGE